MTTTKQHNGCKSLHRCCSWRQQQNSSSRRTRRRTKRRNSSSNSVRIMTTGSNYSSMTSIPVPLAVPHRCCCVDVDCPTLAAALPSRMKNVDTRTRTEFWWSPQLRDIIAYCVWWSTVLESGTSCRHLLQSNAKTRVPTKSYIESISCTSISCTY